MKILSIASFIICGVVLVGVSLFDYHQLPTKIASHFNESGMVNGYTPSYLFTLWMIVIGLGIPTFVSGIIFSIRFFPSSFLNVPHAEYWRAPQNYKKACSYLFHSSLWFGCTFILGQTAFSHTIAISNLHVPPHLDGNTVATLTALLLILIAVWISALMLRFFVITKTTKDH